MYYFSSSCVFSICSSSVCSVCTSGICGICSIIICSIFCSSSCSIVTYRYSSVIYCICSSSICVRSAFFESDDVMYELIPSSSYWINKPMGSRVFPFVERPASQGVHCITLPRSFLLLARGLLRSLLVASDWSSNAVAVHGKRYFAIVFSPCSKQKQSELTETKFIWNFPLGHYFWWLILYSAADWWR